MKFPLHWLFLFFIFSSIVLASIEAWGQHQGFTEVKDIAGFKLQFRQSAVKVNSLKGEFAQEKTMAAITEKIRSRGTLWFKRDNKVRMDYTTPFLYKVVINGDRMAISDNNHETKVNAASNKLFQQINRIMIDCMQGTILDSKDFSSKVFENESRYLIELVPTAKNLKPFLSTIILTIDKKDHSPDAIELNEPSGDKTSIVLKNKSINGQLQDEVFSI
ncbi:MAG TPA: outer membrane lipoprotein carrier protein LolA [Chryseosolibacter sp.]|nr:outer membrane lipoprotein carrier protein LolA [Chryseosolibacter sp.]